MSGRTRALVLLPVTGIGEVGPGADLADLLGETASLRDGDVVVVTSKVVSKAEGRVRPGERAEALVEETDRVVARRGSTAIVRTHHGLVMAAAGIDASNTEPGTLVLLPEDPDASARRLRERLAGDGGPNVAVLLSDTSGRAWRTGQSDIAIGVAGLMPVHRFDGKVDGYGNLLSVTAPAVADEVAGAADLVKGKLRGVPAAVVRGLDHLVLPPGEHGPGAAVLVRPEHQDMFGLGAREAVLHAVHAEERRGFGGSASGDELRAELERLSAGPPDALVSQVRQVGQVTGSLPEMPEPGELVELRLAGRHDPHSQRELGRAAARAELVGFALGWRVQEVSSDLDGAPDTVLLRFHRPTP